MVDIDALSKHDLLVMLRDTELEMAQLKNENEKLRDELSKAQPQQREFGSIAEEAVKVSGVLLAAQKAADDYLAGVKARYQSLEEETAKVMEETRVRCEIIELESKNRANQAWDDLKKKLDDYCLAHDELKSLLGKTQSIVNNLK